MDETAVSTQAATPKGRAICFTSAKGGSGKTVFAASTAYALIMAGKRVLCIDADFSTRGLSLLLLSSLIDAGDFRIPDDSCLAESLLARTSPDTLRPLTVAHGRIEFSVLVSNGNLRRGGVPEDRLLGKTSADGTSHSVDVTVQELSSYLKRLCAVMREQFDYIIIDTRGGFDTTSVVPAIVSDWYCIVLEADEISVQQVFGLHSKIAEYEHLLNEQSRLKGFIVNKALFSPTDKGFGATVSRLYGGQPLGTVPADKAAIKAYQKKDFAFEVAPESDFSFYSYQVISNLVSEDQSSWTETEKAEFRERGLRIRQKWLWRTRLDRLEAINPYVALALLFLAGVGYWITTRSYAHWPTVAFYLLAVTTLVWCIGVSGVTIFARWRQRDFFKTREWTMIASQLAAAVIFAGFAYLAIFDVPRRFSTNILYSTIADQSQKIRDQQSQLNATLAKLDGVQQELTVAELTHEPCSTTLPSMDMKPPRSEPALNTSPHGTINYGSVPIGTSVTRGFLVQNLGPGELMVQVIPQPGAAHDPQFVPDPALTVVTFHTPQCVSVPFYATRLGRAQAQIRIQTKDGKFYDNPVLVAEGK